MLQMVLFLLLQMFTLGVDQTVYIIPHSIAQYFYEILKVDFGQCSRFLCY